jgi:hypothetical protein
LTTNTISNRPRRGAFSIVKPGKGPISTSMIKEIERQSSFGTGPTSKVQQEQIDKDGDSDAATAGGEQQPPRHGRRNPVTGKDTRSIQRRGDMTSEMIKKAGMPSFDFANAPARII